MKIINYGIPYIFTSQNYPFPRITKLSLHTFHYNLNLTAHNHSGSSIVLSRKCSMMVF